MSCEDVSCEDVSCEDVYSQIVSRMEDVGSEFEILKYTSGIVTLSLQPLHASREVEHCIG